MTGLPRIMAKHINDKKESFCIAPRAVHMYSQVSTVDERSVHISIATMFAPHTRFTIETRHQSGSLNHPLPAIIDGSLEVGTAPFILMLSNLQS